LLLRAKRGNLPLIGEDVQSDAIRTKNMHNFFATPHLVTSAMYVKMGALEKSLEW
jgi:hypothetical protein